MDPLTHAWYECVYYFTGFRVHCSSTPNPKFEVGLFSTKFNLKCIKMHLHQYPFPNLIKNSTSSNSEVSGFFLHMRQPSPQTSYQIENLSNADSNAEKNCWYIFLLTKIVFFSENLILCQILWKKHRQNRNGEFKTKKKEISKWWCE